MQAETQTRDAGGPGASPDMIIDRILGAEVPLGADALIAMGDEAPSEALLWEFDRCAGARDRDSYLALRSALKARISKGAEDLRLLKNLRTETQKLAGDGAAGGIMRVILIRKRQQRALIALRRLSRVWAGRAANGSLPDTERNVLDALVSAVRAEISARIAVQRRFNTGRDTWREEQVHEKTAERLDQILKLADTMRRER